MTFSLDITKNVYGGDGLGRLGDGRVCFVPGVFAGEKIRVELVEQKKSFTRGKCTEIVERSPDRVDPPSVRVPGMVYADVSYAAELRYKEEQLGNFLERLGQNFRRIEVVAGRSANYRNKATYHVQNRSGKWAVGYRREFSHDVVDTAQDPLVCEKMNHALGMIRASVTTLLSQGARNVRREVREQGAVTVRYTPADGVKWWFGDPPRDLTLTERTCGHDFLVPADGFYQVNPEVGEKLVEAVSAAYAENAERAPHVVDLYCGVGVFGLSCVTRAPCEARLVGIESGRSAIACAKRNAEKAGVKANFFCERVGGSLGRIRIGGKSTVIVDPPRGGLERNVPAWLAASKAPRVFYVSCDPATLTRDLQALVKTYRVKRVRLFDMFPRTARFETFVELEK